MPILNTKQVQADLARLGWSEARLAQEMGWSHPHYSEVKHRRRKVNAIFMDCLVEAFHASSYDRYFLHPSIAAPSGTARQRLAIHADEAGRPWPDGGRVTSNFSTPFTQLNRRRSHMTDAEHDRGGS